MTDMPAFYPQELIDEVKRRIEKGVMVHTLVLWTKHPASLLCNPLFSYLHYIETLGIQISLQLTISGMGGVTVGFDKYGKPIKPEPGVPSKEKT
jgi:hypothetical protein